MNVPLQYLLHLDQPRRRLAIQDKLPSVLLLSLASILFLASGNHFRALREKSPVFCIAMPSDPDPAFEELLAIGRKLLLQKYKPRPYTPLDTNGAIGNYNVRFQKADWAAEELIGLGVHCSVCFSVSRDLAVFSRRRDQGQDRDPRAFIQWRFRLDALANAAMDGCHFCGFMANRFFDDPGYTFFSGPSMSTQWVRCCGYSSKTEVSESLIKSVANIRKFLEEHSDADFTLVAQPTDYRLYDLEYGKIHFWAIGTSLTPDAVKRILGCRQRIVLEIYAPESTGFRPTYGSFIVANTARR
jgi:hypothetical protein